jgi:tyrosine-protein kinase Etk/Wzc
VHNKLPNTTVEDVKAKSKHSKTRRQKSPHVDALLWRLKARLEPRTDGGHIIGMTSCCRGSGVSTTLSNLAIRAADNHLGPVLLIDANSTAPRLHRIFKEKADVAGLANILIGNAAPGEVVLRTKVEGLDLLPMGSIAKLGESRLIPENYEELMRWVRQNYRLVFVDLPEINDLRHSLLFAKSEDLTLVAVRSDSVTREMATNQIDQLAADGVKVTGTLLTRRRLYTPSFFRRLR